MSKSQTDILLSAHISPRPRIDDILDAATRSKLVYVIAGAGYGKTQAVRSFIEKQQDAVVRWMQLTDSDNLGSRYWEHLTHNIAFDNPKLAKRLREFGFPNTAARFNHFAEILRKTEHRSHKTFLVLDDFHLIHSKQALMFAEKCAHLEIPGACVIIISRSEPEINAVSLFAKGQVSIITEDELRFTKIEIAQFLAARSVSLPLQVTEQIYNATDGWALALQLLSSALAKGVGNLPIALDTMKQNIFKLMETEAWEDFSDSTRKTLARLSLISELPLKVLWEQIGSNEIIHESPQLASFIWCDSYTGQYRVHPLYLEFLTEKQNALSENEKQETYKQAATWCIENNLYHDAFKYMAASHMYSNMLSVLLTYPVRLPPDMCDFFLKIIKNLNPKGQEAEDSSYLLLTNLFIPLLYLGAGDYKKAREYCQNAISRYDEQTSGSLFMLSLAYSNLAYVSIYSSTVTHEYDAAESYKKSVKYRMDSETPVMNITGAFASADVRSFACLVGEGAQLEEFDTFLKMLQDSSLYIGLTSHSMYNGYADLVACEIAFHRNQPRSAKGFAHAAIEKARESNQFAIEAMAAMYLFRIAVAQGDFLVVKELFRQKDDSPDSPYFWNRKFLYDLGVSFIYAQIGPAANLPQWINSAENHDSADFSVTVRELICSARILITLKQYDRALTLLCGAYPRVESERFALGELTLTLLSAAARAKIGDTDGAAIDFEKAYRLSYNGVFEMPFIELGRDIYPLTEIFLSPENRHLNVIPADWLRSIKRKVSVYIKKSSIVFDAFKAEKHIGSIIQLSQREYDVLIDLYHGLSRDEIATNRYLSVNTVHKIIQSLFLKLNAGNKADAIRIATELGIL